MATEGATSSLSGLQLVSMVVALLNHLLKFNGTIVLLEDWKRSLEGAARLCNGALHLGAKQSKAMIETEKKLQPGEK